jgi:hypothetical protein
VQVQGNGIDSGNTKVEPARLFSKWKHQSSEGGIDMEMAW